MFEGSRRDQHPGGGERFAAAMSVSCLLYTSRRADFMDRFAQFAVIAAREAVADAGVQFTPEPVSYTHLDVYKRQTWTQAWVEPPPT